MENFERYGFSVGRESAVVNIPKDIKVIEDGALCGLKKVEEVVVNEDVEEIGAWAFYGCTALSDINLPSGIKKIGENAFFDTAFYNDEKNWQGGVLYLENSLIKAQELVKETYFVKDGTKIISQGAFKDCALLERVFVPDTVDEIGEDAFSRCKNLKAIYGSVDSAAEKYAAENGIKFIAVEYN